MSLSSIFSAAASETSGFAAEQILNRRGFYEIGRRTDAVAWTTPDADQVIRISCDGSGSSAYFNLAQKMAGNPYLPVVHAHKIMKSGEHIVCVKKLQNPSQKRLYDHGILLNSYVAVGIPLSAEDTAFRKNHHYTGIMSKKISDFFMMRNAVLDIDALPEPQAFKEAAVAIVELSFDMFKQNTQYVPTPDINPTNVLWRKTEGPLQPVLYDPIVRQYDHYGSELKHASYLRSRLGMNPEMNI
ncbi:MAG: hypothetical protein DI626_00595 [Micavibrio aeruginosavorus]|uniref:Uncharacterized protein n=1 Tax=Micavibrio aeruginosavorus TaxID=349221 RepID=A0A2W5A6T9_9BACT|nr:MAG: hypothetical protein DI626_00595 [Micavibrio aeruginosavorus]